MPTRSPDHLLSDEAKRELRTSFSVRGRNFSPDSVNAVIQEYARAIKYNEVSRTGWRRTLGRLSIDLQNIPGLWINSLFDRAVTARKIGLTDARN